MDTRLIEIVDGKRSVDLWQEGCNGVRLFSDGTLRLPNGRIIDEPYATGQIALPRVGGGGTQSFNLGRLVAKYFVENPKNYKQIEFEDGNRLNCKASNITWVAKRMKRNKAQMDNLRGMAIQMHVNGCSKDLIIQETQLSVNKLNEIILEFETTVKQAPSDSSTFAH